MGCIYYGEVSDYTRKGGVILSEIHLPKGLTWLGEYEIAIEDLLTGKAGMKKETKLEKAQQLIL